jgi:tetratricopeptide (TPR) repeat protein
LSHALAIDPHLPDAYIARAVLKIYFDWDWGGVQADLETARTLNPNNKRVQLALASLEVSAPGQPNEAMVDLRQELARDPIQTHSFWFLGFAHYFSGRLEESEGAFRSVLQLNPNYESAHALLARCYLLDGRYSEALATVEKESDESWRLAILPMVYWALGRRSESASSLAEEERKYVTDSAFLIAQAHAYRGEADAAFQWLDRAYQQRDPGMRWILADPILRNLRDDPRFKMLLAKLKLADDRRPAS